MMVRTLTVHLDDEDYETAKAVKLDHGMTWEEYVMAAAQELSNSD